jgi:hypothetical protein
MSVSGAGERVEPAGSDPGLGDVVPVRSDRCGLDELFQAYGIGEAERVCLALGPQWPRRWTASWRPSDGEVACAVRGPGVGAGGGMSAGPAHRLDGVDPERLNDRPERLICHRRPSLKPNLRRQVPARSLTRRKARLDGSPEPALASYKIVRPEGAPAGSRARSACTKAHGKQARRPPVFADEANIALPIIEDRHDPQRGTRLRQPETCALCLRFISSSDEPGHHQLLRIDYECCRSSADSGRV